MVQDDQAGRRIVDAIYLGLLRRSAEEAALEEYSRQLQAGLSVGDFVEIVLASDEYREKSAIPLFTSPGHFYSPIVDPAEAEGWLKGLESEPWPKSLPGLPIDFDSLRAHWRDLLPLIQSSTFGPDKGERRYGFFNPAFSWGDGLMLQAMMRYHRPRRIIEIGSGWSSACMMDTAEEFLDGTELTFIDPYPALLRTLIGDAPNARILDRRVQDVELEVFDQLEANDILFIDSSHVVKTGSDCCYEYFNIIPRVKPGVLVHIHDIQWPFEYPRHWAVNENRSWNEIYLVRALLWQSDAFEVIAFNDYMNKAAPQETAADSPDFVKNTGGSLWLKRR